MNPINIGAVRAQRPAAARDMKLLCHLMGEEEIELRPICHPGAMSRIIYDRGEQVILTICSTCSALAGKFKLDAGPSMPTITTQGEAHDWRYPSLN